MATKTWYLDSKNFGGNTTYLAWSGDTTQVGTAEAYSNSGWNVGRNAAGNFAPLENGSEVSRNAFQSGTPVLNTSSVFVETGTSTFSNCFDDATKMLVPQGGIALSFPYNAIIPAGTWTMSIPVQAQNRANGQDGRMVSSLFRGFFRSSDNSMPFTQLSALATSVSSSVVTNLTTTVSQSCVTNFNVAQDVQIGGNEVSTSNAYFGYIIVFTGWLITGAGGGGGAGNQNDVIIRYGTNATLTTPEFKKRAYHTT